jgi:hypothetical protein
MPPGFLCGASWRPPFRVNILAAKGRANRDYNNRVQSHLRPVRVEQLK